MCKQEGKYHIAENVHHVKFVKEFPELALQLDNLLCVCVEHHNEIHDRFEEVNQSKFVNEERW